MIEWKAERNKKNILNKVNENLYVNLKQFKLEEKHF